MLDMRAPIRPGIRQSPTLILIPNLKGPRLDFFCFVPYFLAFCVNTPEQQGCQMAHVGISVHHCNTEIFAHEMIGRWDRRPLPASPLYSSFARAGGRLVGNLYLERQPCNVQSRRAMLP